jgi:hypothetical protein
MKRFLITIAAGFALALGASAPAFAGSQPAGQYTVTPSSGTVTGAHFTATHNASNYDYRAWENCNSGPTLYGSWHSGTGTSSNTAACPSGDHTIAAGFQWQKTNPHTVECWVPGDSRTGPC